MKRLVIQFSESNRKYGYLHWGYRQDADVREFFGRRKSVSMVLDGLYVGEKSIDEKFRRISIGPAKSRAIPEDITELVLKFSKDGRLQVTWD